MIELFHRAWCRPCTASQIESVFSFLGEVLGRCVDAIFPLKRSSLKRRIQRVCNPQSIHHHRCKMVVLRNLPQWILNLPKIAPYSAGEDSQILRHPSYHEHHGSHGHITPWAAVSSSGSCVSSSSNLVVIGIAVDNSEVWCFGRADE